MSTPTHIILEGPAPLSDFTSVLRSLQYTNSRMSSLLIQQPNTENR